MADFYHDHRVTSSLAVWSSFWTVTDNDPGFSPKYDAYWSDHPLWSMGVGLHIDTHSLKFCWWPPTKNDTHKRTLANAMIYDTVLISIWFYDIMSWVWTWVQDRWEVGSRKKGRGRREHTQRTRPHSYLFPDGSSCSTAKSSSSLSLPLPPGNEASSWVSSFLNPFLEFRDISLISR